MHCYILQTKQDSNLAHLVSTMGDGDGSILGVDGDAEVVGGARKATLICVERRL